MTGDVLSDAKGSLAKQLRYWFNDDIRQAPLYAALTTGDPVCVMAAVVPARSDKLVVRDTRNGVRWPSRA